MKNPSAATLLATLASAAFWTTPLLAQHSHDDNSRPADREAGHLHPEVKAAADFAAAVRTIGERMTALDGLLAKGDLGEAHEQSDAIGGLARSLGALALKPDSGVAREKIKEINKAGKALAEAADGVHEAGEKQDLAAAKSAFAQMKSQADALSAFAPAKYFCPMHCEGAKTYAQPGKCPVCSMSLKKQTSERFAVEIKPVGGAIAVGKPVTMVFTIQDPTGLSVKNVEKVHEKLLHLLMVSKDLSWFAHEHPEVQADGTFTLTYTFPEAGEFFLYNDFTPPGVGQQVVTVPITVAGAAPVAKALMVDTGTPKTVDGYMVSLDTGGPIRTGGSTHLAYTVTKDGKPVTTLAPYLGAMGHLVIISEDREQFVHSHPHEHGAQAAAGAGGPKVDFEAHFTSPGTYKGWAQFNVGSAAKVQVITVPFTFSVAEGGVKAVEHGHASAAGGGKIEEVAHGAEMPAGVPADEESRLYLTPGGIYTAEDIKANGSITAGEKYKGQMAKHDAKPKPGDKTCPITMTKANPRFTWIIGGKVYEFCCPPCIDEFVLLAKTQPGEVKDPSAYVKK